MKVEDEYKEYLSTMDRLGIAEMDEYLYKQTRMMAGEQIRQTRMLNPALKDSDVMVIMTLTGDLIQRNQNRGM